MEDYNRHDAQLVAHIAATLLAGHPEAHRVYRSEAVIRDCVAGARMILDEAHRELDPPEAREQEPAAEAETGTEDKTQE